MPRRKRSDCPFTLCGQKPSNGDIVSVGTENLLVLFDGKHWEIRHLGKMTPSAPVQAPKSSGFHIDAKGYARNSHGKPVNPVDVTDILYDLRPEDKRDAQTIVWADGAMRNWGDLGAITMASG